MTTGHPGAASPGSPKATQQPPLGQGQTPTAAHAPLLRRQLAHFQPAGDHTDVAVGQPPYARMLAGIRGLRLHIETVAAKFKYDDHKPEQHRTAVADRLAV